MKGNQAGKKREREDIKKQWKEGQRRMKREDRKREREERMTSPARSGALKLISSTILSMTVYRRRAPMFSTLKLTSAARRAICGPGGKVGTLAEEEEREEEEEEEEEREEEEEEEK